MESQITALSSQVSLGFSSQVSLGVSLEAGRQASRFSGSCVGSKVCGTWSRKSRCWARGWLRLATVSSHFAHVAHIQANTSAEEQDRVTGYGVPMISRLLKIIGLFCERAL